MAYPVRLGIVGAGFTGVQAAKNCGPLARVDAVCIADPNDDRRQQVVEEYGIPRANRDYREILDDDEVDAVYYGVPPDIRLPMVLEGFAAGKTRSCSKTPRHWSTADSRARCGGKRGEPDTSVFVFFSPLRRQSAHAGRRPARQNRPALPRPDIQSQRPPPRLQRFRSLAAQLRKQGRPPGPTLLARSRSHVVADGMSQATVGFCDQAHPAGALRR